MSSKLLFEKSKSKVLHCLRERKGGKPLSPRPKEVFGDFRGNIPHFMEVSGVSRKMWTKAQACLENGNRNRRETCDTSYKNRKEIRNVKMLKSGRHFPLTHSEGKSLNKPECEQLLGEALAAVLTKHQQVFSQHPRVGNQDLKLQLCPSNCQEKPKCCCPVLDQSRSISTTLHLSWNLPLAEHPGRSGCSGMHGISSQRNGCWEPGSSNFQPDLSVICSLICKMW